MHYFKHGKKWNYGKLAIQQVDILISENQALHIVKRGRDRYRH